jgi:hypothetical protein
MASYLGRVELHYASDDDYQTLHAAMAQRGYSRMIVGGNGSTYYLPTGTYDIASTTISLQQALDAANAAAKTTGKNYSIIVAERSGAQWIGLATK